MDKSQRYIDDVYFIDIPKIEDYRGDISVVEGSTIPYEIKRVYYLYNVPETAKRGGHAHKQLRQCLIALNGSFKVILKDAHGNKKSVVLNQPDKGLIIPNMIWRELESFTPGTVCLVLASHVFEEEDYIRNLDDFLK